MSLTLTARETEIIAAVISEMGGEMPAVDFNKVGAATGHKYSRNARSAFKKVWDKLKAGAASKDPGDDEFKPTKKTRSKATPKKTVGKQTAPRKASAKAPTFKRNAKGRFEKNEQLAKSKPKDEESDSEQSEFSEIEDYYESDSDEEEDSTLAAEIYYADSQDPSTLTDDELGARLLGVPLHEYEELAQESGFLSGAPTPQPGYITDDEE